MLTATPIPMLADNYAWLLRDPETGTIAIVDPAETAPAHAILAQLGNRLDYILLTHHHNDHVGGADALAKHYNAVILGAAADAHRLPPLDCAVKDGDTIRLGAHTGTVIATPGHTIGHVSYFFPETPILCCGDTLFSLGCGRLFEGTPAMMFESLGKLASLPAETLLCCGHEYTEHNLAFALSLDPDNPRLLARRETVRQLRAAGQPTLPAKLGDEKQENPFLTAPDAASFAERRAARDRF